MKRSTLLSPAADDGGTITAPKIITKEDFSRQMDEGREILALAMQYQRTHPKVAEIAEKAIKDGTSIRKFQADIIPIVSVQPAQDPSRIVRAERTERVGRGTVGELMVSTESYRDAQKRGFGRGKHFTVELEGVHAFQQRATFGLATSDISGSTDIGGTGGVGITVVPEINLLGKEAIAIANLFGQGQCSGDQIRIVRQLSVSADAARVAEAGNKPETSLDIGVVNFPVEKTAVFVNVTEEMLTDFAQAASFVNEDLSYQVQAKEDNYLLNGTGSSQITGILNTSGIQTLSGAANTIDQFKRAKAYVEGANSVGFAMPDAFVMNPLDWLTISLTKENGATGQYLFGGPGYSPYGVGPYSNVGSMWGIPVVTSTFIAQGTAIVGAFRNGATLFRRAGLTLRSTDSHASNFIANIVTVVAESRFALAVKQPNKFCTITGIPAVG